MQDRSQPGIRAVLHGAGYQAEYKLPGGSWRIMKKGGKARVFTTTEAAKDAACRLVFAMLCPPIHADRRIAEDGVPSSQEIGEPDAVSTLAAEAKAWKAGRLSEQRSGRRSGKRVFTVEKRVGP